MHTRALFRSFCIAHTLDRRDRISFYGCDMRSTTVPCASYWYAAVTSHGGLRAPQAYFRGTYRLSIRRLAQTWRAREDDDRCQCRGDRARSAPDKADIEWRCARGLACAPKTRTKDGIQDAGNFPDVRLASLPTPVFHPPLSVFRLPPPSVPSIGSSGGSIERLLCKSRLGSIHERLLTPLSIPPLTASE